MLGDFADTKLEQFGVVTTFSRSGDKFLVSTEGPDGALHEYEIAYTFGFYPLQQYLIPMPGGRLQALGIAWDSRPPSKRATTALPCTGGKPGRNGLTSTMAGVAPVDPRVRAHHQNLTPNQHLVLHPPTLTHNPG